jgi:hypothetical protein
MSGIGGDGEQSFSATALEDGKGVEYTSAEASGERRARKPAPLLYAASGVTGKSGELTMVPQVFMTPAASTAIELT